MIKRSLLVAITVAALTMGVVGSANVDTFGSTRLAAAQPLADSVSCDFSAQSSLVYKDGKIGRDTRDSPMVIQFTGLMTKEPRVIGNRGSNRLVIIENSAEKIVLIERGEDVGGLIAYTIFKSSGIGVYMKTYSIVMYPFGMVAMGSCR